MPGKGSSTAPMGSRRSARPSTATTDRTRRPFLALTIDLDALEAPWRFDVPGSPYPHIYGLVARRAITAVQHVDRGPDGRFVGLAPS